MAVILLATTAVGLCFTIAVMLIISLSRLRPQNKKSCGPKSQRKVGRRTSTNTTATIATRKASEAKTRSHQTGPPTTKTSNSSSLASNPFQLRSAGLLKELGVGAFAKVYAGVDPTSGEAKAYKFVAVSPSSSSSCPKALQSASAEFAFTQRLRGCPNVLVVDAMQLGAEGSEACLTMPLCRGGDVLRYVEMRTRELRQEEEAEEEDGDDDFEVDADGKIRWKKTDETQCQKQRQQQDKAQRSRNGGLPEAEALEIFAQMAAGVHACHEKGICHLDVKPDNFFLTRVPHRRSSVTDGQVLVERDSVKLGDFGLAQEVAGGRGKGLERERVGGTAPFMAPELVQAVVGGEDDGRVGCARPRLGLGVDMWALGVTLYFMLSGRLPSMDVEPKGWGGGGEGNGEADCGGVASPYAAAEAGAEVALTLNGMEWASVSDDAKAIVRMLMCHDEAKRLTAAQLVRQLCLVSSMKQKGAA